MSRLRKVVFVGGAPRSGTTITHALLCTAPGVSRYQPELSFFRAIPSAYRIGAMGWEKHTRAFFPDSEAFRALVGEMATMALSRVAQGLGDPEILCVKDPLLTPLFPELRHIMPDAAQFVTVCRHPYAVVRSRQEVHERQTGQPFTRADVQEAAEEYMTTYGRVLQHNFGGRLLLFRYEDLNETRTRDSLAKFLGVEGFDTELLWVDAKGERPDAAEVAANPWGTPKYGGTIELESRLPPLAAEWRALVGRVCEPVMSRMGYT